MNDHVKVFFELEQDEDDYPPFSVEAVWAETAGEDTFKIDNIPFYAKGVSLGDIVYAPETQEGRVYRKHVTWSENSTIRVIVFNDSDRSSLFNVVETCGCDFEVATPEILIAVSIPPTADIPALLKFLNTELAAERMTYEESAKRYDF